MADWDAHAKFLVGSHAVILTYAAVVIIVFLVIALIWALGR